MPDAADEPKTRFWKTSYAPGGWVRLDGTEQRPGGFRGKVFLRLVPGGHVGMPLVREALITGDGLSSRTWRMVPIVEVEAYAQNPDVWDVLTRPADNIVSVVDVLDEHFASRGVLVDSDFIPEMPTPHADSAYQPIRAPKGRLTDDFLRQVAAAYARATASKVSPAPAIAEEAGVPVRTVHGWIARARKIGVLRPARPGRAG